mmetsp:Transcript_28428/g.76740  ORF Transcript_28428/g.76740 Transcript_28428/m.76740 type:complete len:267 (-) Transcript_28428:170-970(-)
MLASFSSRAFCKASYASFLALVISFSSSSISSSSFEQSWIFFWMSCTTPYAASRSAFRMLNSLSMPARTVLSFWASPSAYCSCSWLLSNSLSFPRRACSLDTFCTTIFSSRNEMPPEAIWLSIWRILSSKAASLRRSVPWTWDMISLIWSTKPCLYFFSSLMRLAFIWNSGSDSSFKRLASFIRARRSRCSARLAFLPLPPLLAPFSLYSRSLSTVALNSACRDCRTPSSYAGLGIRTSQRAELVPLDALLSFVVVLGTAPLAAGC